MREYFDQLKQVPKQEFIENFHLQETDSKRRKQPDGFSLDRIPEHERESHNYFKGRLNQRGIDNLILPSHIHPDRTNVVDSSGQPFNDVIHRFSNEFTFENSPCAKKAHAQLSHFFDKSKAVQEAEFIYLCNNFNVSHPKQYSLKWTNKLFIGGGFHRLIAYGLFIEQNGFSPLKVYYCEVN
ncbi:MAG: hypothetical protein RIG77_01555 [Cyclobacteriaceae bacterium]